MSFWRLFGLGSIPAWWRQDYFTPIPNGPPQLKIVVVVQTCSRRSCQIPSAWYWYDADVSSANWPVSGRDWLIKRIDCTSAWTPIPRLYRAVNAISTLKLGRSHFNGRPWFVFKKTLHCTDDVTYHVTPPAEFNSFLKIKVGMELISEFEAEHFTSLHLVATPAVRWSGILKSHVRGGLSAASLVICSPHCSVQCVELRGYCPV